ncbi:MAG: GDSL-type esterase/lipase family protein [Patescibacteria group bacterium]|nr:GDSL-type esterase/lipase family protein [Patescibacteria group bacterium]
MRKLHFYSIIAIAIFAAILIWYPRPKYDKSKIVVAFGDSITSGYCLVPPQKDYVVYLSDYTNIPIINAGKRGDNTADALIRLQSDVLSKQPNIVIVFLGANDFLEGYSSEVVTENLTAIVEAIQKSGAKVILVGGDSQVTSDFEIAEQNVATKEKVFAFIPNVLNGILFRKDLVCPDGLHPNEKGHEIIAKKILPALQRALSEK